MEVFLVSPPPHTPLGINQTSAPFQDDVVAVIATSLVADTSEFTANTAHTKDLSNKQRR